MLNRISVIGAGAMGNGIAHLFALHGFRVILIDTSKERLETALVTIASNLNRQVTKGVISEENKLQVLSNISCTLSLEEGVRDAQLVIEAATENQEIKFEIFRHLDTFAPAGCILATNTSSISITKIASVTKRPASVIGMHFMNPVPVMKLVEIINGYSTAPEVTQTIVETCHELEKTPCQVNDYPGFITNRILMPMINEAIQCLHEGVAGVGQIDIIMKLGLAHPMGPLQLADFIGLDVCHSILQVLYDGFGNSKYAPCPLLTNMVNAGHFGMKTGEGFYTYLQGNKDSKVSQRFQ